MNISLGQSSTPDGSRIYAIGDVHGCLDLLRELHTKINMDLKKNPINDHRIIFLGDYIDRGSDSAGCVEYLINLLSESSNVICLKGNHEVMLEKFLTDSVAVNNPYLANGGIECATSYGVDMSGYSGGKNDVLKIRAQLNENIPAHHREFYSRLKKTVTFGDYMFVHAGVRPGVALDQQSDNDLMWIRYQFLAYRQLYEKVIIHGHTPLYPMEPLPNRVNVDTYAYHTGVLSCVVLEGQDFRILEASLWTQ